MDQPTSFLVPVVVGLCSLGCFPPIAMDFCRSSADRSASIDATGATKVVISTGAGDLSVRGDRAARSVSATGRVCAANDKLLEQVRIETRREGSTLYLHTVFPEVSNGFPWLFNHATLDLAIILPAALAVELEDGSGDIDISRVRTAKIADSAGDIAASRIRGNLSVADGSGDMDIKQVSGQVKIERDGSGDVRIADVRGDVNVLLDSSGALQFERIGGSVRIGQDSSGDIIIREVKGNAQVDSDSSGDIRVVQVGGDFIVEGDSTGEISHDRIEGSVRLPPDRDRDE